MHSMHIVSNSLCIGTKACGSCEEVSEFLDQATLLRGISHQNVLAVMGLCSDDHQAPIVIYSYPSIGNLHTFLTAHKQATSATRLKGVRKNHVCIYRIDASFLLDHNYNICDWVCEMVICLALHKYRIIETCR